MRSPTSDERMYIALMSAAERWRTLAAAPHLASRHYAGLVMSKGTLARMARQYEEKAKQAEAEAEVLFADMGARWPKLVRVA